MVAISVFKFNNIYQWLSVYSTLFLMYEQTHTNSEQSVGMAMKWFRFEVNNELSVGMNDEILHIEMSSESSVGVVMK